MPSDVFHLPTINEFFRLQFPYCNPPKTTRATLLESGSVLGLAPSNALRQINAPPILKQLMDKNIIEQPVWSVMLINSDRGILSIGGTNEDDVEEAKIRTQVDLETMGQQGEDGSMGGEDIIDAKIRSILALKTGDWREGWRWTKVQGAEGWWQVLMQGVWIDGAKILKNQPVVIDVRFAVSPSPFHSLRLHITISQINTPFVLAPPWQPANSTTPSPAPTVSLHPTTNSTSSPASIHQTSVSSSGSGSTRRFREARGRIITADRGGN